MEPGTERGTGRGVEPGPEHGTERGRMTYVIAEACIDVKDGDCTNVCPVDCIYEGGRMFYIQPDECVNCAVCVSVCPVEAIFAEEDLPPESARFLAVNAEFFGEEVTGWGSPGGFGPDFRTGKDHPAVAARDPAPAANPSAGRG